MREEYWTETLSEECNSRFEQNYTSQDIEHFIQILGDWDLLREEPDLLGDRSNGQHTANGNGVANGQPIANEQPSLNGRPTANGHSTTHGPSPVYENYTAHDEPETVFPPEAKTVDPDFEPEGDPDATRHPYGTHIFNPQPIFDFVLAMVRPLRYLFLVFTPIFFVLGTLAVAFHWYTYVADLTYAMVQFGKIGRIAMEGFTILLMDQLARGVMARWLDMPTPSFGARFIMGIIPRFHVRIIPSGIPDRRNQLMISGGPMLMRFLVFGLTGMVWIATRGSGTFLPKIAVEVNYLAVIAILLESNPLWRGDGPRFLSALLNVPDIQQRRRRALIGLFVKEPPVLRRYTRHRVFFAVLGLISCVLLVGVFGFVGYNVLLDLQGAAQGTGVALFVLGILWGIHAIFGTKKAIKEIAKSNEIRAARQPAGQQSATQQSTAPQSSVRSPTTREPIVRARPSAGGVARPGAAGKGVKRKWLRYALLIAFSICLFLPYDYDASGTAQVYPAALATLSPESDGTVDKVFYNGGEWVHVDAPLAQMDNDQQIMNLRTTEANLEAKEYDIRKLKTTPLPEQVEFAEMQAEAARVISKYADETLERNIVLFKKGVTSPQDFANYEQTAATDRQLYVVAQANLAAIKAQVNPNQIAEDEAQAEVLKHQIVFCKEELRRTTIRSPIEGRIETLNLQYQVGSFLKAGTTFAMVEDLRKVPVQVAVPESDSGSIAVGATVVLRLWAYGTRNFTAVVDQIQPAAQATTSSSATGSTTTGQTVTIIATFDNPDGLLKGGLTGEAKIRCERTLVIVAFTKALVRFVRIEIWSWLP